MSIYPNDLSGERHHPIGIGTSNSYTDTQESYNIQTTSNTNNSIGPKVGSKFIQPMVPIEQTPSNNGLIRPMQFEAKDKDFEEKIYILLYTLSDIDEDDPASKTFSVCIGRTMAYNDIKTKLQSGLEIDVHRSHVMTETKQTETKTGDIKYFMIPYEECMSVYAFCTSIGAFYSDEFDIEDYADGDVPEDDRFGRLNTVLSSEQIEYRRMLEEAIGRDKFIDTMRQIYGPESSNNV